VIRTSNGQSAYTQFCYAFDTRLSFPFIHCGKTIVSNGKTMCRRWTLAACIDSAGMLNGSRWYWHTVMTLDDTLPCPDRHCWDTQLQQFMSTETVVGHGCMSKKDTAGTPNCNRWNQQRERWDSQQQFMSTDTLLGHWCMSKKILLGLRTAAVDANRENVGTSNYNRWCQQRECWDFELQPLKSTERLWGRVGGNRLLYVETLSEQRMT
jgi:hypothetical protein